jgi:hypothetical protein
MEDGMTCSGVLNNEITTYRRSHAIGSEIVNMWNNKTLRKGKSDRKMLVQTLVTYYVIK